MLHATTHNQLKTDLWKMQYMKHAMFRNVSCCDFFHYGIIAWLISDFKTYRNLREASLWYIQNVRYACIHIGVFHSSHHYHINIWIVADVICWDCHCYNCRKMAVVIAFLAVVCSCWWVAGICRYIPCYFAKIARKKVQCIWWGYQIRWTLFCILTVYNTHG